ncbi:hypothetical protein JY97_05520 [Alkalispirochaeta odontotermitis]|nr:hypothetical protein JY97_05520 [Alkalispirochaeta odontotermitis]CAB1083983.1 hypothetical protein D1AOALGA4SA_11517 [Olavius algarvensis Delta 1 endosymbiont]
MFYMKKSSKYWLLGAICIILINLIVFIFRNHIHELVLLWVVILTPVGCLVLYPLTSVLAKSQESQNEKG